MSYIVIRVKNILTNNDRGEYMTKFYSLDQINLNDEVIISQIKNTGMLYRRLLDMGLTKGSKVKCVLKSPSGEFKGYLIRGAVIAIRDEDARNIMWVDNNG